jgi:GT2 family glycosyltransferase
MDEFRSGTPLVSIIILNYNGKWLIEKCLDSILHSDYSNFEVIFFDNNSSDGSVKLMQKKFGNDPRVRIIGNDMNSGFAAGNNLASKHARGAYLVFLNNDTEVDSNWLRELVAVMECDPTVGAAQSKLLQTDRKHYDSAGDSICPWGLPLRRGEDKEDFGQYDEVKEIFSARGAALITRSALFREVGMFDSMFFLQLEDVDLCWRIRLRGSKILFVPSSVVFHRGSIALRSVQKDMSEFMSQRNRLLMTLKNYSCSSLFKYFPMVLMLTIIGAFRRNSIMKCRVQAVAWIVMNFGKVWSSRLRVQRCVRRVPDSQILKYMPRVFSTSYV